MFSKIESFAIGRLAAHPMENDREKHLYLSQTVSVAFSLLIHVIHLIFFAITGNFMFSVANIFSIITYLICLKLVSRNAFVAAGVILTLEVTVYTLLASYMLGANLFITYLLVTMFMQMLIPYAAWPVRISMMILLWAGIIITTVMDVALTPVTGLGNYRLAFSIFNAHVGIVGIVVDLYVDRLIRRIVGRFNQERLEKYKKEAHIDELTGLYNRRYASSFFENLESGEKWCVAMLDIDDFKAVNDTYGHAAGDVVLETLARTVKSSLRKTDLVFRWGGEEFLILIKDIDKNAASKILDKLRKNIEDETIDACGHAINVTVTIGVSILDTKDPDASIKASDKKMYEGKFSSKNVVVS